MGPSLLIATCLIVAIRTAKWSASIDVGNSNSELDKEITYAANVANRVLSALTSTLNIPKQKAAVVQSDERGPSGLKEPYPAITVLTGISPKQGGPIPYRERY